jgi:hypothetical protein
MSEKFCSIPPVQNMNSLFHRSWTKNSTTAQDLGGGGGMHENARLEIKGTRAIKRIKTVKAILIHFIQTILPTQISILTYFMLLFFLVPPGCVKIDVPYCTGRYIHMVLYIFKFL